MKLSPILLSGALALAMGLPIAGCAQQTPAQAPVSSPAGEHHHGGMMRMLRGVNLTDQQKTQLQNMMQQYRQAHPKGSTPDPQARKALHQQMMSVLTPAQQAQVKQNMQQMRAMHKDRDDAPAPTPTPTP